jgi:Tol biopolymer transport system component
MPEVAARLGRALADRYEIEREVGQGGMATVYLARDLRHDRQVALKVLRPELASILGAERFLSEIKTTAHLQHPHILPLHDSGEADGLVFYVMPYVEGESLRDRLAREKQLPVDEAVRIATEVAGALDYAHRHQVVHRDIKPENILLHEGQALVADFGIALAASRTAGGTRLTETGMSLGTPAYMAPEQAMGEREVTPKADIYALGCVLYEMLTGEPPFTGPTAQAIVARVMTEQPRSLTLQRRTIPPNVEAAVTRALEKLPADRFATAGDFASALTNPSFAHEAGAASPGSGRERRPRAAVAATAVAVLATAVAVWALVRPAPPRPAVRYGLALPASQTPTIDGPAAASPDGSHIVYVGPGQAAGGNYQLWVKARDRYDATPLSGTGNVWNFTFSPDGQWIAFVQGGQLKKLPIVGGSAITLADSVEPSFPGLAWLDDGSIVYVALGAVRDALRRVPDVGGLSQVVWRSDSASGIVPTALPGGRGVLFVRCAGGNCRRQQDLWVLDFRSGSAHALLTGVAMGQYLPTGHLVYVRPDGGMFAVPFRLGSLSMHGSPVPILDSIEVVNGVAALASLAADGTLLVRVGAAETTAERFRMVWVDRTGGETPIDTAWAFRLITYGANAGWALSPDGSRVAIGLATSAGDDIWIKQLPRGPLSRLTFDSAAEFRPRWTPDGKWVTYGSNRGPVTDLYEKPADGTGSEKLVLHLPMALGIFEGLYSRDGRWLVVRTGGTTGQVGGRDIWAIRPGVDSVPRAVVSTPAFDEAAIALSPDGRWLAYESNETGRVEVYVRPFPNTDAGKWQVSTAGGVAPLWARNGRELFFVNGNREMVVIAVPDGSTFRPGAERVLFRMGDDLYLNQHENYTPFDISLDGSRFLMARRVQAAVTHVAPLIVVENWFTELRALLARK